MNEAETRAELIDPLLKQCGWGVVEGSRVLREYQITAGKIQSGGKRGKKTIADYVLVYKGIKLAVIEAKKSKLSTSEGVAQAKEYANLLKLDFTYASNGKDIYAINMKSGREEYVTTYPTPDELWNMIFAVKNEWREKFAAVPFEDKSGSWQLRYYQEIAVSKTMEAIANDKERILLTLATGTGKTAIAFQIAWKLFKTRWNIKRDGLRQPRILFLADRNVLATQAFNSFSAFPEEALKRIKPDEIKKTGKVPTNGSIFFTIFQTFMSGKDSDDNPAPYFGEYSRDYFDFIIIDECHRGGANDEGNWRGILEYFSPAVQLGLTATPKRKDNVDTYKYFGEPVYIYSLKEGINDGFLTPFKVKRIKTTLDDYIYTSDDTVIEGEVEQGKQYTESDFNKSIEIQAREAERVQIFLNNANPNEKTIIFCATQEHAGLIRDIVNQKKSVANVNYCVRVTANDGKLGEQYLEEFQDNERTIPTILTTSQKLSTGVDARNVRNIVLLRPVNSMIEFKQIVGRGTRTFDGKDYFTIYDYVDAYKHFADPEWDGEPLAPEESTDDFKSPLEQDNQPLVNDERDPSNDTETKGKQKVKIKLRDGKEREIQHMISTSFWNADGKPISAEEFLNGLLGDLPELFKSEEELITQWSNPATRKELLERLMELGYDKELFHNLQKLINAENSDLFDVLEYVFNSEIKPITRADRVEIAKLKLATIFDEKQKEFINFVLDKYIEIGVEELSQEKLPVLLELKYNSLSEAQRVLGEVKNIRSMFVDFQQYLYRN
ncbi:MAG: DEAD/DEAH box helicase [Neisseriaceae bacterium]|nr:MAG: DEAD/DEAH box helicase [Neisseriaceae bacterium]